jgi:3-dehydroquinate dehydratase-1
VGAFSAQHELSALATGHRPRPTVAFKLPAKTLTAGHVPRIVGVLSSIPKTLPASGFPSDLVEIRLDAIPLQSDWLECGRAIQSRGWPVILTIRLQSEGGKWTRPDADRLPLFQQGLKYLSAVDVELESPIAASVSRAAKRLGKTCIVSYHNFELTPPLAKLAAVVSAAQPLASIVKISTMARRRQDVETLRSLLLRNGNVPLCVIGMGSLGTPTRVSFAALGSCLTYGYLDKPSAPGQLSAAQLAQRLRHHIQQNSTNR